MTATATIQGVSLGKRGAETKSPNGHLLRNFEQVQLLSWFPRDSEDETDNLDLSLPPTEKSVPPVPSGFANMY